MGRLGAVRAAAAVTLLAFACAGCAARWAYRQGQDAAEKGDWDLAVARLTRAVDKDPRNIGYKIALENARIQASRFHYDQARKSLAANDLTKAASELEIASNYDPANRSASDDLAIVRRRIEKQKAEQEERDQFDQMRARARAARLPIPVLSPRETAPILVHFENEFLQKIFETLGKLSGVNVLFDEGYRDKKTSVDLRGLSFQEALDRLTMVNRLFYKVLDQNTIIIVPESVQNRRKYDEVLLRTFYLQNAEIDETANLIKTLARITTVGPNKALGAITVLGTLDQIAMAERIIDSNDKARGEVIVEIQILEVNRSAARDWGLALSNYTASATLSPTGASGEVANGVLTIRPYLLSSLNQADWIVTLPSSLLTQFIQTENTARILAAPRLRAAEGKKTEMKIGTEVPVPVTSIGVGLNTATTGGLGGYYPATSFNYRTVGVTMSLTPRVAASGDITLEVAAEFSLLGPTSNLGTSTNPLNIPQFLTRAVNATLRLRDGETGLIGGLLQGRESKDFSGSLGMNQIPIIGKLLGTRHKESSDSEILMSITPRITRAPKLTEEDFIPLRVGTQEVPRVEGARPGLFGPEETAPATGAPTAPGAQPPAGTAPSGAAPAVPVPVPVPVPVAPGSTTPPPAAPTAPQPTAPGATAPGTATPGTTTPATPTPDRLAPPGTAAPMTPPPITMPPITTPETAPPETGAPMTPGAVTPTAPAAPGTVPPYTTTPPQTTPPETTPSAPAPSTTPAPAGTAGSGTAAAGAAPAGTAVAGTAASGTTGTGSATAGAPGASAPGVAVATRPMTVMLSPPDVSLRVGQSAGAAVVLVGGRDVLWVDLTLAYDTTLAQVTDVSSGSLLTLDGSPLQAQRSVEPGRVRVRYTRTTPVTGSGGVAAITLRGLKPGQGVLAVEVLTVGRTGGTETPALPSPGRLVVAP